MKKKKKQDEIIEEFSDIDDWMDRYANIIDYGQSLKPYPEQFKTPKYKIEGCQSDVWINAELNSEGKVEYMADCNTSIIKGILAMLVDVLSGHTPREILDADLYFIKDIGLSENLSPMRSNGILASIKQMKLYALAFQEMENSAGKE